MQHKGHPVSTSLTSPAAPLAQPGSGQSRPPARRPWFSASWADRLFALLTHVRLAGAGTRIVQAIAPVTLGIYAIHPFWIDVIERAGFGIKQPGGVLRPLQIAEHPEDAIGGAS